MKRTYALFLALITAVPAFALDVDSTEVAAAAPVAQRLSLSEEVALRLRKALAELTLFEMRKNEWLLNFVGTETGTDMGSNAGRARNRVVIAVADTAASATLLALMGRFAAREWYLKDHRDVAAAAEMLDLHEINIELKTLLTNGLTELEWATYAAHGITPTTMREEIILNDGRLMRLSARGQLSSARRIGRGVALVVLPALAVGVIADLRSLWLQVALEPAQLEARRAELEDFVRSADTALANVSK